MLSYVRSIFSHARGENYAVHAVHNRRVLTDIFLYVVSEQIDSQLVSRIVQSVALRKVSEIAAHSRNSEHTGFFVEVAYRFGNVHVFLVHQVFDNGGVHVAAAGAHGHAFERREAHRGFHRASALDCGNGGAVAEVAGNNL